MEEEHLNARLTRTQAACASLKNLTTLLWAAVLTLRSTKCLIRLRTNSQRAKVTPNTSQESSSIIQAPHVREPSQNLLNTLSIGS